MVAICLVVALCSGSAAQAQYYENDLTSGTPIPDMQLKGLILSDRALRFGIPVKKDAPIVECAERLAYLLNFRSKQPNVANIKNLHSFVHHGNQGRGEYFEFLGEDGDGKPIKGYVYPETTWVEREIQNPQPDIRLCRRATSCLGLQPNDFFAYSVDYLDNKNIYHLPYNVADIVCGNKQYFRRNGGQLMR
jgi:hypothetical protein